MMPRNEPPDEPPGRKPLPARGRPPRAQPLAILDIDGGLLTLETVMQITGLSKSTIYRMMGAGTFPESVRVGKRGRRHKAEEIRVWVSRQCP